MLRVKLARIAKGIKQYEMAAKVEYNPQLWSQVEQGLRQPPPGVAKRASEILSEPVEELFRPVGEKAKRQGGGRDGE